MLYSDKCSIGIFDPIQNGSGRLGKGPVRLPCPGHSGFKEGSRGQRGAESSVMPSRSPCSKNAHCLFFRIENRYSTFKTRCAMLNTEEGRHGPPPGHARESHPHRPEGPRHGAFDCEYSVWYREAEKEPVPSLEGPDIGLVCPCPLGRGDLTGTLNRDRRRDAAARQKTGADRRDRRPISCSRTV